MISVVSTTGGDNEFFSSPETSSSFSTLVSSPIRRSPSRKEGEDEDDDVQIIKVVSPNGKEVGGGGRQQQEEQTKRTSKNKKRKSEEDRRMTRATFKKHDLGDREYFKCPSGDTVEFYTPKIYLGKEEEKQTHDEEQDTTALSKVLINTGPYIVTNSLGCRRGFVKFYAPGYHGHERDPAWIREINKQTIGVLNYMAKAFKGMIRSYMRAMPETRFTNMEQIQSQMYFAKYTLPTIMESIASFDAYAIAVVRPALLITYLDGIKNEKIAEMVSLASRARLEIYPRLTNFKVLEVMVKWYGADEVVGKSFLYYEDPDEIEVIDDSNDDEHE